MAYDRDAIGDRDDVGGDLGEHRARLLHELCARGDFGARLVDQVLDLLGSAGRTLGELADFLCDDGKALAGLTGTGGLDARVQCQKVGLECDLVDDIDDLHDLARGVLDPAHGINGAGHDRGRGVRPTLGIGNDIVCLLGRSADDLTVTVISSTAAAVSSRDAACCSVRLAS